ncbi:ribosomal RNA small subunit methyltransferase A [Candidatus Uhrbacteria bacterium]|nr:ribosomal RNA small subunit methyltransferase A [Candidatus Uhrbacteria bacterium]
MAKKSFGQHFLHDVHVIDKILAAARPEDFSCVVEVGPGRGALTERIVTSSQRPVVSRKKLVLIEADRDLIPDLRERFPDAEIIQADAANVDYAPLVGDAPWLFVSNLPYNAASAIVMRVLAAERPPARMVVMVQKEVGERMLALSHAMSVLSVAVGVYADVERVCVVKPGAFTPPPAVDSMALKLTPIPYAPSTVPPEQVIAVAKAGFANRRKFLAKNIAAAGIAPADAVVAWLTTHGFSDKARAEELTVADWIALADTIAK